MLMNSDNSFRLDYLFYWTCIVALLLFQLVLGVLVWLFMGLV